MLWSPALLPPALQDADVNSPLPMELGPTLEQEGTSGLGSRSLEGLRSPQAQELNLESLKSWGGSILGPWLPSSLKTPKSKYFQPQGGFQRHPKESPPMALGPQGALKVRTQALTVAVVPPCSPPQASRELVIPGASVPCSLCCVSAPVSGLAWHHWTLHPGNQLRLPSEELGLSQPFVFGTRG